MTELQLSLCFARSARYSSQLTLAATRTLSFSRSVKLGPSGNLPVILLERCNGLQIKPVRAPNQKSNLQLQMPAVQMPSKRTNREDGRIGEGWRQQRRNAGMPQETSPGGMGLIQGDYCNIRDESHRIVRKAGRASESGKRSGKRTNRPRIPPPRESAAHSINIAANTPYTP